MDNSVYIVGGGVSLKGFDFKNKLRGKRVIAVNKAINFLPRADFFITMDYTFLRKINNKPYPFCQADKIFVLNLDADYIMFDNGLPVDTRFNLKYELQDFDVVIKSYKTNGIGFKFSDFRNGENSGFCALQFAVIMGFSPIYLLGIDLKCAGNNTHFHNGYGEAKSKFEQKLERYYQMFFVALSLLKTKSQFKVYSCSPISRLNDVIPFKEI